VLLRARRRKRNIERITRHRELGDQFTRGNAQSHHFRRCSVDCRAIGHAAACQHHPYRISIRAKCSKIVIGDRLPVSWRAGKELGDDSICRGVKEAGRRRPSDHRREDQSIVGTATKLTSSPNPSSLGQGVTLTASVAPLTATGTVTFKHGSTTVGTGVLSHGQATFSTSTLPAGSHSLTAVYRGDANDDPSTSAAVIQVVQ